MASLHLVKCIFPFFVDGCVIVASGCRRANASSFLSQVHFRYFSFIEAISILLWRFSSYFHPPKL